MSHIIHNGIRIDFPTASKPFYRATVGKKSFTKSSLDSLKAELRKNRILKPFAALALPHRYWGRPTSVDRVKIVSSTKEGGRFFFVSDDGRQYSNVYPTDSKTSRLLRLICSENKKLERIQVEALKRNEKSVDAINSRLKPINAADFTISQSISIGAPSVAKKE